MNDTTRAIAFASVAALGNALFALGQKQSQGISNGLIFVAASALIAVVLAALWAPAFGAFDVTHLLKSHLKSVLLSGVGLFLTYLGFNLLYSRFGASQYTLYAALSIITTTIGVGYLYLKEPVNGFHLASVFACLIAIGLFAIGQSRLQ
jgi:drug/metabolite transporter (DMT)-like permease